MHLLIKTAPGREAASEIRRVAMEADPEIPVGRVTSLEQIVGSSISGLRSPIWMFLGFAATALLLATIGVYGLMRSACA
jgi:hypothetical protein